MEEQHRVTHLVGKFLRMNFIHVSSRQLKLALQPNSEYPGIGSVLAAFSSLDIQFSAYEIENKELDLARLPPIFMTLVVDYRGINRIAVVKKKHDGILVEFENGIRQHIGEEVFVRYWSGIAIAITGGASFWKYYFRSIFPPKNTAFILALLGLVALYLSYAPSLWQLLYFMLSAVGLFVGILIFTVEMDLNSGIAQKVCGSSQTGSNCRSLIRSESAVLFPSFKLGDAVIVYFALLILSHVIFGRHSIYLHSMDYVFALLSIPVILYSLYLQWKLSTACALCLSVIMILISQLVVLIFASDSEVAFSVSFVFGIMILSLALFFLWRVVREIIGENEKGFESDLKYRKLKQDFRIFEFLLHRGGPAIGKLECLGEITFGNRDASVELILVTNPDCPYCKEAYRSIDYLLENYGGQIRVIFRMGSLDGDASELGIAYRLLEIYHQQGERECYEQIRRLFHGDNWDVLGNGDEAYYKNILYLQRQWMEENALRYVPILLVNQHLYPVGHYDIDDLRYFIDHLILID